jgi:hypothetical protein
VAKSTGVRWFDWNSSVESSRSYMPTDTNVRPGASANGPTRASTASDPSRSIQRAALA